MNNFPSTENDDILWRVDEVETGSKGEFSKNNFNVSWKSFIRIL